MPEPGVVLTQTRRDRLPRWIDCRDARLTLWASACRTPSLETGSDLVIYRLRPGRPVPDDAPRGVRGDFGAGQEGRLTCGFVVDLTGSTGSRPRNRSIRPHGPDLCVSSGRGRRGARRRRLFGNLDARLTLGSRRIMGPFGGVTGARQGRLWRGVHLRIPAHRPRTVISRCCGLGPDDRTFSLRGLPVRILYK